jgi:hypothetical protein
MSSKKKVQVLDLTDASSGMSSSAMAYRHPPYPAPSQQYYYTGEQDEDDEDEYEDASEVIEEYQDGGDDGGYWQQEEVEYDDEYQDGSSFQQEINAAVAAKRKATTTPKKPRIKREKPSGPSDTSAPPAPGRLVASGQEQTGRWTKEEHEAFLRYVVQSDCGVCAAVLR